MAPGEAIVLDGALDEAVWKRAVSAGEFVQQDPVLGAEPTERTEVRFVFNQDHLYMGVICFDSEPDKLQGNTSKRDEFLSADDRFMWTMDTFLNQQTGYFFEMNPAGLMADALMGPGGSSNREWDGIWNARVRQSEIGWTIEIDIPFRSIAFDPNAPAWGVNFQRTVRRKTGRAALDGGAAQPGAAPDGQRGPARRAERRQRRAAASSCARIVSGVSLRRAGPEAGGAAGHRPRRGHRHRPTTSRPACAAWPRSTPTSPRPKSTSGW